MLDQNYLGKDDQGNYNTEYSTASLQYDYTTEVNNLTTIPESIGLISRLANKEPNLVQMKKLTITLCNRNPELIETNLDAIKALNLDIDVTQLKNRKEGYDQLKSLTQDQIKDLFKEISGGLDIKEIYQE